VTPILAAFLLSLGLIASTALLGFLALSGAWYLTHRQARPYGEHRGLGFGNGKTVLDAIIPPPIVPEPAEIVIHPELEDYIRGESEGWYREELRKRAKDLYQEHGDWPWVLSRLRELNEANSLPEI